MKTLLTMLLLASTASTALFLRGMSSPATADLVIDRSLVEREQQRIEADCAVPEASPATTPFSLSRPEVIVFTETTHPEFGGYFADASSIPSSSL